MNLELPLTELRDGESATITSVRIGQDRGRGHGRGSRGWGLERRLADMGLTPGTRVTATKSAPLHGPLEVLVRGTRLALGRGVAERVFVEVER
jgi:Fe2+ transport system protein FeoA